MVKVEIKNLPQFQASLKKLEARIIANIERALKASANDMAKKAKERVPVKTGSLKNSISVKKGKEDLSFLVQAEAPHARFVEFGSFKTPARPFMVPTFEEGKGKTRERIIKAINGAIKG